MNWDAIGAIGEVTGALAVVITLVLLMRQLRENTKSVKAATSSAYMQTYSVLNANIANLEMARIVRIGMADPAQLTEDETQAFYHTMWSTASVYEGLFNLYQQGSIPEVHWLIPRNDIVGVTATPGGRAFFESLLPQYEKFYPDFAIEIRACIAEDAIFDPRRTETT